MLHSFPRASRAGLVLGAVVLFLGTRPALAGEVIGWRTDGSGSYPKAQPPREWSPTKNVVWSTPMPGYGVSHPVLLDQRIFICSEPATLLCLNREDGKILWQETSSYSDLEIAPDVREQIKEEQAEMAVISRKESSPSITALPGSGPVTLGAMNAAILLAAALATADAPPPEIDATVEDVTGLMGTWDVVEVTIR
jgi:hypothetical protein